MDHQPNVSTSSPYAAIFQQLDDAVVVLDSETCITHLNPSAQQLLQSPENAVIGQPFDTVMKQVLNIDLSLATLIDTQLDCQINVQQQIYKLTHNTLAEDQGAFVVFSDVTTQHTLAKELSRLETKYSKFAHTVAHDVKSPLGVAIGYANMLQDDLPDDSEVHIFADEIFATSMRIMYICNELVVLAEFGQTKPIELTPVNVLAAIETSRRRFKKDIESSNISLDIPQTIPYVMSNLSWLEEIMINIFKNLIHDSGVITKIKIEATQKADQLIVHIRRDGEPLTKTDQDTLFEMSRTIDDIRAEGSGLGIDITKQLVEHLKGEIGVTDGHSFYLKLPIVDYSKDDKA